MTCKENQHMKKLNGAIIGFGAVAQNAHTPAFLRTKNFDIQAIADTNPKRLETAKKFFPKTRFYKSDTELLKTEKNLHFIDISTPPTFHYKTILKAFEKNLHVLCEKPLVFKKTELENLAKISKQKKLVLFTVHNWKYAPPILKATKLINKLGNINHLEFKVLRSKPSVTADKHNWRANPKLAGGGIFTDHGWHNLYLAYNFAGRKNPNQITAKLKFDKKNTAETKAQVFVNFQNITASLLMTWQSPIRYNSISIYGEKANLEILDDKVILLTNNKHAKIYKTAQKLSAGSAHPEWMYKMLGEFLEELKNPKQRGKNLAEARTCLNLLQAGYKSAKTNKSVKI